MERKPELAQTHILEIGSIVSAACLAHDLGNPPFGHSGERAIASYFLEDQGIQYKNQLTPEQWADITHFDGNANAFRLLTHQFKGRRAGGFVLTYSTLSSIVKYPFPATEAVKQKFGYFTQEKDIYDRIAIELGLGRRGEGWFRHPLAYLVEAADDICYEIMDIEDAHKLKILSFEETRDLMLGFLTPERRAHIIERSQSVDDKNENVVYFRSCAIGALEQECVRVFVENEEAILNGTFDGSLVKHIEGRIGDAYKACEKTSYDHIYRSKDVVDIELAGYKIISTLIDLFTTAAMTPDGAYSKLLLERVSKQYEVIDEGENNVYRRIMAVLDYISGMTDVYAFDLFS
jgi:dGTPase